MAESTGPRSRRKPDRPKKPYPDFPLTPHASGAWQKKICGKTHYFGKWGRRVNGKLERIEGDGWEDALALYKVQADDLHAGRTPRVKGDEVTLADLCNQFLTDRTRSKEAGELGLRMFAQYKEATDLLIATFGANRLVDDLAADDFGTLRAKMAKRWGPVMLGNVITRVKTVFKFGFDNSLIKQTIRYGSQFKKPGKTVLRKHRATSPAKMFEADELRKVIDAADTPLKAMILLGLNAGLGNTDCSDMGDHHANLATGWLDYPRPKTGVKRRCPLWPETVAAIREAIAKRPKPAQYQDCGRVFLTAHGTAWVRLGEDTRSDYVSFRFKELVKKLGLHRSGLGFYTLRHVFRTVADGARDTVAIDLIMGHNDPSMGAVYRERIDDARLKAVTDHVRVWLWPKQPASAGTVSGDDATSATDTDQPRGRKK